MGVTIMSFMLGMRMGPPADNEYAEDPVAVATTRPSPLNLSMICPSIERTSVVM